VDQRLQGIVDFLKGFGKFNSIVDKIEKTRPLPLSFVFEALFAYAFERNGLTLDYEKKLPESGSSTPDFLYRSEDGKSCCFELIRPEMSEELKIECEPEATEVDGVYTWKALLHGSHQQQHLRPEALTIRMQEKLLEKVGQLPSQSNEIFSFLVVDCSNFHFGHIDDEDCRMVMWGKTITPEFQESWVGNRIQGLLEESYNRRNANIFRERITGVIFVPEIKLNPLDGAYLALNNLRLKKHLDILFNMFEGKETFRSLRVLHLP
jgi:hypothetical protein